MIIWNMQLFCACNFDVKYILLQTKRLASVYEVMIGYVYFKYEWVHFPFKCFLTTKFQAIQIYLLKIFGWIIIID